MYTFNLISMLDNYHIAFIVDSVLLEKEKMIEVLVGISQEMQISGADSFNLSNGWDRRQEWHSQDCHLFSCQFTDVSEASQPSVPPEQVHSSEAFLRNIDLELRKTGNRYLWSFFPWSTARRFRSFVFLSKDKNIFETTVAHPSISRHLISKYTFNGSAFHNLLHSLLIRGDYVSAYPLWDACKSSEGTIWMVTDLVLDEDFSIHPWWVPYGHILVDRLDICTTEFRNPLYVYEISTRESFKAICRLTTQEPDTLVFVPSNTDINKLSELMRKIESDSSYSDLTYFQEILDTAEWFFGLGRDWSDHGNALFVSRQNELIQTFNLLAKKQAPDYEPTAFF